MSIYLLNTCITLHIHTYNSRQLVALEVKKEYNEELIDTVLKLTAYSRQSSVAWHRRQ